MYGKGIIKGLGVTLKRLVETYLDDLRWGKKRYNTEEGISYRMSRTPGEFLPSSIRKKRCQFRKSLGLFHSWFTMLTKMARRKSAVHLVVSVRRCVRRNVFGLREQPIRRQADLSQSQQNFTLILISV